jgi:hypothetical protein
VGETPGYVIVPSCHVTTENHAIFSATYILPAIPELQGGNVRHNLRDAAYDVMVKGNAGVTLPADHLQEDGAP